MDRRSINLSPLPHCPLSLAWPALGACLLGDEEVTDHLLGGVLHLLRRVEQAHSSGSPRSLIKKIIYSRPDPDVFEAPRIQPLFVRIRILPSSNKNSKKNLDFYCSVTSLWLFLILQNDVNVPSKCNKQKCFWLASGILKVPDEKSRIRIRTKMSRILNTDLFHTRCCGSGS